MKSVIPVLRGLPDYSNTSGINMKVLLILVTTVDSNFLIKAILKNMNRPSMKVSDIHVTSVITMPQDNMILGSTRNLSMKVSDILVNNVITRLHVLQLFSPTIK